MAGIYIHIPFCRQACDYCNFHFSTSLKGKNDFLRALLEEIRARSGYLPQPASIETIYFGGGTPSLLSTEDLAEILRVLRHTWQIAPEAELTLEANPDDIFPEKAAAWRKLGINRLSIGIQSFFDEDLRAMHRAHDASQALRALETVRKAGFSNLSVDLIYGLPDLSDARWAQNLQKAIDLEIPHLSCYALTVEPRTALAYRISQGRQAPVDPDKQAAQFLQLMDRLEAAGYDHYEISNFALPGFRSRHNSAYWQGIPYIGLGPSAHSYNGRSRQWNLANNARYLQFAGGLPPFEAEDLDERTRLNEYIMTSLRTREGLDLAWLTRRFGKASAEKIQSASGRYLAEGLMELSDENLRLTRKGRLFADGIASDLFQL